MHTSHNTEGSFFYVSVNLILAVLLLSIFSLCSFFTHKITLFFQENIQLHVYLEKNLSSSELLKISNTLSNQPFVLYRNSQPQIQFISKQESAHHFIQLTNENFLEVLEENPLRDIFFIKIDPSYQNTEACKKIKETLEAENNIFEVVYIENMVSRLHKNFHKIKTILAIIGCILTCIVIFLVKNTIKLTLFTERFLIRSMLLIGAQYSFIRKSFLRNAFHIGLTAGLVIVLCLIGVFYLSIHNLPILWQWKDFLYIQLFLLSTILISILIMLISTFFIVNHYLYSSLDDLYSNRI